MRAAETGTLETPVVQGSNFSEGIRNTMSLIHPRTISFLKFFARAYPARTAMMVTLLGVSGLLEGISVVTLVPLLEVATQSQPGSSTSGVGEAVQRILLATGIQPTLAVLVVLVVLGITLKAAFLLLASRQIGFTVAKVTLDLRLDLVRSLLQARWSYFGGQPIGVYANSISRETVRSAMAYREACAILSGVFQMMAYVIVSALLSWQVTAAALVTGAFLLRVLRRYVEMGRSAGEEELQLTRSLVSRLVDALQGIKPMKAMAREDLFWPLLEGEVEGLNRAQRKNVVAGESLRAFQEPIVTLMLGLSLVFLLTVAERSFSSVMVLAFVFYRLMSNINTLQMRYQFMANGESSFWSLRNEIDQARAAEERHSGTLPPHDLADAIELRDVSFSYDTLKVLDRVNMRFPARRMTALIGASGSGKTTILDLITGLHRPGSGDVYLDGVPLADLDLKAWRRLIGYVPQDVFLFHDTVRRNVTLGDDSISDERVIQALKDAGAWDFISRSPEGINALISPQGFGFSGGQRQRLAIARALVKNPTLIVLDEATTGLDAPTEAAILETLSALRGRVTVLAISHQPALREAADLALELRGGSIHAVESVTHEAPRHAVR